MFWLFLLYFSMYWPWIAMIFEFLMTRDVHQLQANYAAMNHPHDETS